MFDHCVLIERVVGVIVAQCDIDFFVAYELLC